MRFRKKLALRIAGSLGAVLGVSALYYFSQPRLEGAGPRHISNQTAQPVALYGAHFRAPMNVELRSGGQVRSLAAKVVDSTHAYLRLPADLTLAPDQAVGALDVLIGPWPFQRQTLDLVNDTAFTELRAFSLSFDGKTAFVLSSTTDTLYTVELLTRAITEQKTLDGPIALAPWHDSAGDWLVVAHEFVPSLLLIPIGDSSSTRSARQVAAPADAAGLLVLPEEGLAFVSGSARNEVWAVDLRTGETRWTSQVAPNPKAMALLGHRLAVASQQAGQLDWLDPANGKRLGSTAPTPATKILSGHTKSFQSRIMGGKAPRDLVAAAELGMLFVSGVGPNIGPNPEHMEVSANSGVSAVGLEAPTAEHQTPRFLRHFGLDSGVTEGMVYDRQRALLFVADPATGRVHSFDAKALAASDLAAEKALLSSCPVPPPVNFPLVRPREQFSTQTRSGIEVHSGPFALQIFGTKVFALNRFTGTLAVIETQVPARPEIVDSLAITTPATQVQRRLGQILFYADLGRTSMSCDACHHEGHDEGVLFTKTRPMRIYRSPTLRGIADTPPYFVPISQNSLAATAKFVGDRNRFHHPDLSENEVEALTLYSSLITPIANPFVDAAGAPPEDVALLSGEHGNAVLGLGIFNSEGGCVSCHPPPLFALDQSPARRGELIDIGTLHHLPLSHALQEDAGGAFPPPSLIGGWDSFPMLSSGSAGFSIDSQQQLTVSSPDALAEVLTRLATPKHGAMTTLSLAQRRDLLAYLMTL